MSIPPVTGAPAATRVLPTACPLDCPDTYTDFGEGACFNDARVELERVQGAQEGH